MCIKNVSYSFYWIKLKSFYVFILSLAVCKCSLLYCKTWEAFVFILLEGKSGVRGVMSLRNSNWVKFKRRINQRKERKLFQKGKSRPEGQGLGNACLVREREWGQFWTARSPGPRPWGLGRTCSVLGSLRIKEAINWEVRDKTWICRSSASLS